MFDTSEVVMGRIRSAVDEAAREDLRFLSDAELEDSYCALERASWSLEAERARRLVEIDRRDTVRAHGFLSISSWLAHRLRMGFTEAKTRLRMARALVHMPHVRAALAEGKTSPSVARALVQAREGHGEEFEPMEQTFLAQSEHLSIQELSRVVRHWRGAVDHQRALADEDDLHRRRELHVSPTLDGMVRVDGDLDPETGQSLITALDAVETAEVHAGAGRGVRTPAQRRADALGVLARRFLDDPERPTVGTERPHVTVLVDLRALAGDPAGRAELTQAGPITPEEARRLACDAAVSRVIVGPRSEPLDVGRRTDTVPAPMRRALVVRDEGRCRFPGCGRPHTWCDAHHIVHWQDGGKTSLDNLVLLCRGHHRLIHRAGAFEVRMHDDRPVFLRHGEPMEEGRAPPRAA